MSDSRKAELEDLLSFLLAERRLLQFHRDVVTGREQTEAVETLIAEDFRSEERKRRKKVERLIRKVWRVLDRLSQTIPVVSVELELAFT